MVYLTPRCTVANYPEKRENSKLELHLAGTGEGLVRVARRLHCGAAAVSNWIATPPPDSNDSAGPRLHSANRGGNGLLRSDNVYA
jgi:hypothetical protein